jgi:hypothetical protein
MAKNNVYKILEWNIMGEKKLRQQNKIVIDSNKIRTDNPIR